MVLLQNNNISHIILIGNKYVEKYFQMINFSRVWTDLFKYTQKEESVSDCGGMEIDRLIVNTGSVCMGDGVEPWVPWPKAAQHKLFPPSLVTAMQSKDAHTLVPIKPSNHFVTKIFFEN